MEVKCIEPKKKYLHLEAMRIIAVFFVIFNHTGDKGYFLFSKYSSTEVQFWIYLAASVFCKFSVPLFLAISGAIMLKKEESDIILWRKRIIKIVVVLIGISYLYYYNMINATNNSLSIKSFLRILCSDGHKYHLWYLYLYIAFLMGLPFLRNMVKELKTKYFYYLIILAIVFNGILPVLEYLIWKGSYFLNNSLKPSWLICSIVLYPCIGYFLQYNFEIKNWNRVLILWTFNILGITISCFMTYYKSQITGVLSEAESQGFHSSFVILNILVLFITIKYIFLHWNCSKSLQRIILSVGKCTFGIYLLHPLVKDLNFMKSFLLILLQKGINAMVSVLLYCVVVMIICYVLTLIAKKIPILNKLI